MTIARIRQDEEEEATRRRRHVAPPPPPVETIFIGPASPQGGGGRRGGEYYCYCPRCDYLMSIEEGQDCSKIDCPVCGTLMRPGPRGISQAEPGMGVAIFGLIALAGIGLWAVSRKA